MNNTSRGRFCSKSTLALFALALLTFAHAQTNANHPSVTNSPPAPRRPNIILILADNIGYGDLGCYGQTKIKTPELDKLAAEGIRFTSYYAGSPNDEASRASLFTGLQPRNIGASFSHPLPRDAFTVAAFLHDAGYSTGLIGEWNLGDTPSTEPNTKGFDEFAGFLNATHARDYFTDSIYRQDNTTGSNRVEALPDNLNNAHHTYVPNLLGEMATRFIQYNLPDTLNHYQSFFLCLAYPVPHGGNHFNDSTYANESWPQPEKDRAAMITRMDNNIGQLLGYLSKFKADTNTVVIFTSIGGPNQEGATTPAFFNSAGKLRGEAGSVYEGGIRVPMIIRWPARIKPGQVNDFSWAAWDFFATAADIALSKPSRKTDGQSIYPLLIGKGQVTLHSNLNWESSDGGVVQQAARQEDWKIIQEGTNAPALYNLKTDVAEKEDVAGQHPDVAKRMGALLNSSSKVSD